MKSIVKKFLFGLVIVIGIISMLAFRMPLHTQTDLMSLVETSENDQWPTNKISDKFSSVINIVVESDNEKTAFGKANQIINLLNTDNFSALNVQSNNFSLKNATKDLIPYKNGLLSEKHRELLLQNKSRQIADDTVKQISESMMPPLVPIKQDPFLLLSDYLMNINSTGASWTLHNNLLWQYTKPSILQKNMCQTDLSADLSEVLWLFCLLFC